MLSLRQEPKTPEELLELNLLELTREYVKALESFVEEDFEKASEYYRFLARLLYLKSRYLLPRDEEREPAEVPEAPERLKGPFSVVAEVLDGMRVLERDVFCAPGAKGGEVFEADPGLLVSSMIRILERMAPVAVEVPRLEPIFNRIYEEIRALLEKEGRTSFEALSQRYASRLERVVLFLVLLELSFRRFCLLIQGVAWSDVEVIKRS